MKRRLIAGAGKAEVNIPEGYFPDAQGFCGLHDQLHVRVLIIEYGETAMIVSFEMTSLIGARMDYFRNAAAKAAGLNTQNVWVLVTHTFSVPHLMPAHVELTAEQKDKDEIFNDALKDAMESAIAQAIVNKKYARIGVGIGKCGINVNRDILTEEGWWIGRSEEGPSDKRLHVIRIDGTDNIPIAILFHYAVQSSACQGAKTSDGALLISGDIAGQASEYVEEEYKVPAIFLLGAAGDQVPILAACSNEVNPEGKLRTIELGEQGYLLMEQLGRRLGAEVVHIASGIQCNGLKGDFRIISDSVSCAGQKMDKKTDDLKPSLSYQYVLDGNRSATIDMIKLGEIIMVGTQAELSTVTADVMTDGSPYPCTLVCTMVNGGAKYMARKESYQMITYEAMNSPYACGSAEKWENRVLEMLEEIKREESKCVIRD